MVTSWPLIWASGKEATLQTHSGCWFSSWNCRTEVSVPCFLSPNVLSQLLEARSALGTWPSPSSKTGRACWKLLMLRISQFLFCYKPTSQRSHHSGQAHLHNLHILRLADLGLYFNLQKSFTAVSELVFPVDKRQKSCFSLLESG